MGPHTMEWDFSVVKSKLRSHDDQFKLIRLDIKGLSKRFDKQDRKFEKLYNLISKFTGRINTQDKEIAAIAFRKEEHEARIKKLETTVFATA